jgi:hypothetical protein
MSPITYLISPITFFQGDHYLQDIELLKNDDAWLEVLGALIIIAPTTAYDFLRQFDKDEIIKLMDVKKRFNKKFGENSLNTKSKPQCVNGRKKSKIES